MFLKFLGTGAAFNYSSNNNCAYFKLQKTLYIFDMGEKICDKILYMNLLDDVDEIVVFITHLHSDHIGSLEPFLYWNHYFSKIKTSVFYPYKENLEVLLKLMGLEFPFQIFNDFSSLKDIKVEPCKAKHIEGSFSYFVYFNEGSFYYSGDTSEVSDRAIRELKEGKIEEIYHEVTTSKNSMIHTHISALTDKFDLPFRKKIILMHLANEETARTALEEGFQIAVEE